MASANCTSVNSYYASAGGNSWSDSTYFYSGYSNGSIYRSKVSFVTPSTFVAGNATKLTVAIKLTGTSSPRGCYGVLHSDGSFATNKVVSNSTDNNGRYDGPHPDLTAACIDESYACSDTSGTVQTGYNQASGYTFYFNFDNVSSLKPSTTYYLYAMKYVDWQSSYSTSSGWTQSTESNITITVDYIDTAYLDVNGWLDGVHNGGLSNFGTCDVYVGGSLKSNDCGDYYTAHTIGSSYEIKDITATTGHNYAGVNSGSLTGTIASGGTSVRLAFNTNYVKIAYGPNGGVVTSSDYSIDQWGWISAGGTNNAFQKIYYGNNANPYNATTFGLIRPGYTFNQWNLNWTSTNLDQDTDYASTVYANGSSTTANTTNFYTHLLANWAANSYTITLDPNGGSVSSTSQSVAYSNGAYTSLPTPTYSGKKFAGWFADIGNNGPINLGRDYMYTDKLLVSLDAYMDDWSTFGDMRLVSCTEGGGWNIEPNNGYIQFSMYDSGVGYKTVLTSTLWSSLSSGWHSFAMIFNGSTMLGYIDNILIGSTDSFSSGAIGYNANNVIWIGAESVSDTTQYTSTFAGLIRNFIIKNDATKTSTIGGFAIPCQNITLYADWETAPYMYVKVDGEWKLGQAGIKLGDNWIGIDSITSLKRAMYVSNLGDHDFVLGPDGWYRNTNQYFSDSADGGIESVCLAKVRFYLPSATNVTIEYQQDSELEYDYGIISSLDGTLDSSYYYYTEGDGEEDAMIIISSYDTWHSMHNYGSVAAGWHNIYVKYQKDSSGDNGTDTFKFRLIFT